MITLWLLNAWRWFLRLWFPPPAPLSQWEQFAQVNGVCPACGAPGRSVELINLTTGVPGNQPVRKAKLMWTCANCKGASFSKPLATEDADKIMGREVVGI